MAGLHHFLEDRVSFMHVSVLASVIIVTRVEIMDNKVLSTLTVFLKICDSKNNPFVRPDVCRTLM